jgi:RNA 2',3'-cyclic 3'-phosphodiesterase
MTRCFISLDLPEEVRKEIEHMQKLIQKKTGFLGKLVEFENLHLTLKFLGEIEENKLKEVESRLKNLRFNCFEAEVESIGTFANDKEGHNIHLWIRINNCDKLQKEIDNSLKDLFKPEDIFMAHITLARIKKLLNKQMFLDYLDDFKFKKLKFAVKEFYLKKSILTPLGPIYENLEKYSLN